MADHHVRKLEHDLTGEVVVPGEEFSGAIGEDELHGGGTTVAARDGNREKTWRDCIAHLKIGEKLKKEREGNWDMKKTRNGRNGDFICKFKRDFDLDKVYEGLFSCFFSFGSVVSDDGFEYLSLCMQMYCV